MSTRNNAKNAAANSNNNNVEVLYQKMGNRWFAFSVVEGEVFMGSISQEEIEMLEAKERAGQAPRTFNLKGNS